MQVGELHLCPGAGGPMTRQPQPIIGIKTQKTSQLHPLAWQVRVLVLGLKTFHIEGQIWCGHQPQQSRPKADGYVLLLIWCTISLHQRGP